MKMSDILATIASLASSQGFYGRLLRDLRALKENDPDRYEALAEDWESRKFGDAVDFILFIEG